MSTQERHRALVSRVRERKLTIVPGVFDMLSARIADRSGFHALYMTGYGIAASHLGLPDAGLASYADMVDRARTINAGTKTPLIADADTGFGGLLNVDHTVRGYEQAGVAAIQIEDQEFPKKCGHARGRQVIATGDMVKKIEVAVTARCNTDLLVIARTDARTSLGLDEAIRRGQTYAEAGADVVFIESPQTEDEFKRIANEVDAPLLANMVEGGFSPLLSADQLETLGFAIALYPGTGLFAAAAALTSVYASLHADGDGASSSAALLKVGEMHSLMGFEEVWDFDERWADRSEV